MPQVQGQVLHPGPVLCPVAQVHPRRVFGKGQSQQPVPAVLDIPVTPHIPREQGGLAGKKVAHLAGPPALFPRLPLHAHDVGATEGGQEGKARVGRHTKASRAIRGHSRYSRAGHDPPEPLGHGMYLRVFAGHIAQEY